MAVILFAHLAALLFSFFVVGCLVGAVYGHYAGDALVEFFLDGKRAVFAAYARELDRAKRTALRLRK